MRANELRRLRPSTFRSNSGSRRATEPNPPSQYAAFPSRFFKDGFSLWTICASKPAPAIKRKCRDSRWLTRRLAAILRGSKASRFLATVRGFVPKPNSTASTFAVPPGRTASGTGLPTRPFAISFKVPSPPNPMTWSTPRSTASRARAVAEFGPDVGTGLTLLPSDPRIRERSCGFRRRRPATGL